MNEEHIQQVLEIEKQANAIHDNAIREAEQFVKQADQEAQTLIQNAQVDAQEEAGRLVGKAKAEDESARILAEAKENIERTKGLAMSHFDRAVSYVLDRAAGRE